MPSRHWDSLDGPVAAGTQPNIITAPGNKDVDAWQKMSHPQHDPMSRSPQPPRSRPARAGHTHHCSGLRRATLLAPTLLGGGQMPSGLEKSLEGKQ